jgi:hypothetical protein
MRAPSTLALLEKATVMEKAMMRRSNPYNEVQPDCCAASAIRDTVLNHSTRNVFGGTSPGWSYRFNGLSDAQSQRWLQYRETHIAQFNKEAGKAFNKKPRHKNDNPWGAWLNNNWLLYGEFCLQYAAHLDLTPQKTHATHGLSTDEKEHIREAYKKLLYEWEDNWSPEEQGYWPGPRYHICANHIIDGLRLCGQCGHALVKLHDFVRSTRALIASNDEEGLVEYLRYAGFDLEHKYSCRGHRKKGTPVCQRKRTAIQRASASDDAEEDFSPGDGPIENWLKLDGPEYDPADPDF